MGKQKRRSIWLRLFAFPRGCKSRFERGENNVILNEGRESKDDNSFLRGVREAAPLLNREG